MTLDEFEKLNKKHPYLTHIELLNSNLVGIVQNSDNHLVSVYDYSYISVEEQKIDFLNLGKQWWEESNRLIPIDIFLREEFNPFKGLLRCISRKDIQEINGPLVNLEENFQKRIKRKRIQLIRKFK